MPIAQLSSNLKVRFSLLLLPILFFTGCSPFFVVRAGWEEMNILLSRQDIRELIESDNVDAELKAKLQTVLKARDFSQSIGLKPGGSFTQYSKIDRDVLVWVLSASPKISLTPLTWWFPIVGNVPYKGFFKERQGIDEARRLKGKKYDVYLRPSPAFSTLGWFDDPLLSTTTAMDEVSLSETVIHEILHNTVWIKNNAPFNETLANFVGMMGAAEFYESAEIPNLQKAALARNRWHDQLIFGEFLAQSIERLSAVYERKKKDPSISDDAIIEARDSVFTELVHLWKLREPELKSGGYHKLDNKINNAIILAHKVYLEKPQLFDQLYRLCGSSINRFVAEIKLLAKRIEEDELAPYDALEKLIADIVAQSHSCSESFRP